MIATDEKNLEITGMMVDRLLTIGMRRGDQTGRDIIPKLYECASQKLGSKPVSLVAAQRMIDQIKPGDNVFLVTGFASWPRLPRGENDGPLGIASLARTVRIGFDAVPIIVAGSKEMDPICKTVEAAEVLILDYEQAKATSAAAAAVTFPSYGREGEEESKKFAASILDKYAPKAVISVETAGPNKKGIKHFSNGNDAEVENKLPGVEYIFTEASTKGILTIGVMDRGNEIGSGTIEEDVRRITPWGDVCRCPCQSGISCTTKTDVIYPAAVSNWGAYGITAMVAYLLGSPDILQDIYIERRMLDACIRAGAVEGPSGRPAMSVDDIDYLTGEAMLTMLHGIIRSALKST